MTLDVIKKLLRLHEESGCVVSSREMWQMVRAMLAHIEKLEAEIDALRKDAEQHERGRSAREQTDAICKALEGT